MATKIDLRYRTRWSGSGERGQGGVEGFGLGGEHEGLGIEHVYVTKWWRDGILDLCDDPPPTVE
ncbi:hypothetical protein ABTX61_08370 [Amycolatopsis japonica]|uniref:hypothetical protein n=1 Tax=Amycolatopsis japonica TaxID=208439 RepID=UPI00332962C0